MGRQRQGQPQQPQQPQQTEGFPPGLIESVAAALVAGGGIAQVAPLLLGVIPPAVLTGAPQLAAEIAENAARLTVSAAPVEAGSDAIMQAARIQALTYRAAYALAAARRLGRAVMDADPSERSEALRRALAVERRHLASHVDMTKRRLAGARATSSMAELHGPILSWNHGETRMPVEPRPMHLAADGMNFDVRLGPPAITGVWPGVLPWCSCAVGPPKRGAGMLAGSGSGGTGGPPGRQSGSSDGGDGDELLRNHENARIPTGKLTRALEHATYGEVARQIGFTSGDEALLERAIREGLREHEATIGNLDQYGQRWTVIIPVTGPNGTTAPFVTGWIFDPGGEIPRSTTIFGSQQQWRRWRREGRL